MPENVDSDQFVIIRIEGMHCHKCEEHIKKALTAQAGVREAEVDFNSGQASVLFSREQVTIKELLDAITAGGYRVTGFTQSHADRASSA